MEPSDVSPMAEADALFRAVYEKRAPWSALRTVARLKRAAAYTLCREDPSAAAALTRLVSHPDLRTDCLRPEPALASLGPQPGNTLLDALLRLALRHADWRAEPENWRTGPGFAIRDAVAALARHLLCLWPVPAFLDTAWFLGDAPEDRLWRGLFVHIGQGQSLRHFAFPAPLTERARHFFLQAPDDLTPVGALRWGQALGAGGDERLARAAIESRLGELLPGEPFWESVLRFFVAHPELPRDRIGPVVDYLFHRRCGADATEPTLSMKGRTPAALWQRVEEWHADLARAARGPRKRWEPMGLPAFCREERDPSSGVWLEWSIVELTDAAALQEEGSEMRHCVRSYAGECVQGAKAVFSLRLKASDCRTRRRMLTVEVNPARRAVVQVRGKANCLPKAATPASRIRRAGEVVREWARERRLGLACDF